MKTETSGTKRISAYENQWEIDRKNWADNCASVDEVVSTMAATVRAELRTEEIASARFYTWQEEQVKYSISMSLIHPRRKETVLRVFSAAWIDDEARGMRRSIPSYHIDLATPVRPLVLHSTLEGLMEDIVTASSGLARTDGLIGVVNITEAPLSKRLHASV